VDKTGCFSLGRYKKRHNSSLAKRIKSKGEFRTQFHHVIDIAPTVLAAAGIPHPDIVNSIQQDPIEGYSMNYSFDNANAEEIHDTQYFEMFCNRGIYHKGWTAVTRHGNPWLGPKKISFDKDVWELYEPGDWTQSKDISKENPEKLKELQRLFLIEAVKYNVLPLDDRTVERFNPDLAGRPQLIKGNSQILFSGMGRLSEGSVINIKNKTYSITAEIVAAKKNVNGVIVAQGGSVNGWSLYTKDGKLKYCYNFFGIKLTYIESNDKIPSGKHQVRMEFKYDGGGLGKGGHVSLYIDGKKSGEGRVEQTVPMAFSADETCDVGFEGESPVSEDYDAENNGFNGDVNWVQIDIDEKSEDLDHLISPEERLKIAMAKQ
jgi:arylsulfatase